MHYTKVLFIDSKLAQVDFKWYAWEPENNPQQKELIEEFIKDSEGNLLRDDKGNSIKNPKYDPSIDPETGTKKTTGLVWFWSLW
ncbi:hypothetical protein KQ878_01670 [Mycoplasma zalophidermidis]|uniref:Uncharacterized protein n=1 Tax=Mycoplasma zalophidermidis TaxID=398174 RepID=A0ABS6DT32_9MOLU|nr:hypothetical protein [Mycoplasma zalophidermidis]MBU4689690.1 hypothetical protein [Mycoplasma zalophidermidis]MBU4693589.1 hypothetical protein [Mycoplasma zalophidermidis]